MSGRRCRAAQSAVMRRAAGFHGAALPNFFGAQSFPEGVGGYRVGREGLSNRRTPTRAESRFRRNSLLQERATHWFYCAFEPCGVVLLGTGQIAPISCPGHVPWLVFVTTAITS